MAIGSTGARTAFGLEFRIVACMTCGAPLDAGPGRGGCAYCGSVQDVAGADRAVPRYRQAPDEVQRLAMLASQLAGPQVPPAPPADISRLFLGVEILPWKTGEALEVWKATYRALEQGSAVDSAERLMVLTLALVDRFGRDGELLRQRALLESAIAVLSLPRHRQGILCALSRCACRSGETQAAEAWLSLCDPSPVDLFMDSAFRAARAYLDTACGRFDSVLHVLGTSWGQVPIAAWYAPACAALAANALERTGRTDRAVDALDRFGAGASGYGRLLAGKFMDDHREWKMCAGSRGAAEARQKARGVRLAGQSAGSPVVLNLIASFLGGAGIIAAALLLLVGLGPGWALYALGMAYFVAAPMHVIGIGDLRQMLRARRLRASGRAAAALVLHVQSTNKSTMGVLRVMYRLLVVPAAGSPFEAFCVIHADGALRARLAPGSVAVVRHDPGGRRNVYIEVD